MNYVIGLILFFNPVIVFSQNTESTPINKPEYHRSHRKELLTEPFDVSFSLGFGNKSHLGNFGLTSNLYFTKRVSLKVSAGVAAFNYSGLIASGGAEFVIAKLKGSQFSIGTVYSFLGAGSDRLGDDDSKDYVWYHSAPIQCIRSSLNYSIINGQDVYSFELGSSFTITPIKYSFDGPGTPTQRQINNIERGLKSGWMVTITAGLFSPKKRKINATNTQ